MMLKCKRPATEIKIIIVGNTYSADSPAHTSPLLLTLRGFNNSASTVPRTNEPISSIRIGETICIKDKDAPVKKLSP